ncbi:MAG TPA: hypothetical protein VL985_05745 [Stellaceae bacterium]|nr:hypothetical protein [Stellaceae bacterium]
MVTTTSDPMLTEHLQTWVRFTRLIRYVLVSLIVILALLSYFLL